MIDRIILAGKDPVSIMVNRPKCMYSSVNDEIDDGVVDSMRYLLTHDNYNKPWSNEHLLVTLLTKAF